MNQTILKQVVLDLNIATNRVVATLELLADGATIPFIARYRKEKTENLDEEQIKAIQMTYDAYEKLYERKEEVLRMIQEKGKLTPDLEAQIREAKSIKLVDELYLPYKEKKKNSSFYCYGKWIRTLS